MGSGIGVEGPGPQNTPRLVVAGPATLLKKAVAIQRREFTSWTRSSSGDDWYS